MATEIEVRRIGPLNWEAQIRSQVTIHLSPSRPQPKHDSGVYPELRPIRTIGDTTGPFWGPTRRWAIRAAKRYLARMRQPEPAWERVPLTSPRP